MVVLVVSDKDNEKILEHCCLVEALGKFADLPTSLQSRHAV